MVNPDSFEAQALEKHRTSPRDYFDVHVGIAPRNYILKPARDLEGVLPEVVAFASGVTVFHQKGGFFCWGEDYEYGEHEPGHILVRMPYDQMYVPALTPKDGFYFVAEWAERLMAYTTEDAYRIVDYMVVDRDITEWGNGNERFIHRTS